MGTLPGMEWASWPTPFLLFTGKGGVGKTTVASAVSVALADAGRRVLLVSTDPASNLADVFAIAVTAAPVAVDGVAGLEVMNLDPDTAASAYRRRVVDPLRGLMTDEQLRGVEEQLAGECTVEVAAFDQFTQLMVRPDLLGGYDHVVFDTAPTGHTLRLLNLPSAWSEYLQTSPEGASCLGPRSGLQAQREQYQAAVGQLADGTRTTLVMVSRPDPAALREAGRASAELAAEGIANQHLVVNGLFDHPRAGDAIAQALARWQAAALEAIPAPLQQLPTSGVPLVAFDLNGVPALRRLIAGDTTAPSTSDTAPVADGGADRPLPDLDDLVDALASERSGAVMVMGKGGVGKTTIAAALAVGLARRGYDVHLSTTDPAGRIDDVLAGDLPEHLTVSRIDPAKALADYTVERMRTAAGSDAQHKALLEEDLRSPCTEELAVFRAFSGLLNQARNRFVIVDTAPSGHTLRLLDLTGSYHRQVMRSAGDMRSRMTTPMMRLQDPAFTRVIVVALPELTPVSEAAALQDDLHRAGIQPYGWVINASLTASGTQDPLLRARAGLEATHLRRVRDELATRTWLVPWQVDPLTGQEHLATMTHA